MADVDRIPWGNIDPGPRGPRPPGLRGMLLRLIAWALFGVFIPYKIFEWLFYGGGAFTTFTNLIGVTKASSTAAQLALLNTLQQIFPILATILLNTVLLFAVRLSNRNLIVRLIKTISLIVALGIVTALAVLMVAFWMIPNGSPAEVIILPALVGALFVILAISAPFIPIWPVNVPDNRVWMILDSGGHLLRYVGAGTHYITPREYGEPYTEQGDIDIIVDDESYATYDAFPYRLRMRIQCTFNPLDADPTMWVPLRDETRLKLRDDLRAELEFIVRHEVARYWRQGMSLSQALQTIVMDIREAIEGRQHMGIRLAPLNAINIILDPPEMILEARQRRLSVEALAIADKRDRALEFDDLLKLVSPNLTPNVSVNPQGQLTFALNPGDTIGSGDSPPPRYVEGEAAEQTQSKDDETTDKPDELPEPVLRGLPAGPGVERPVEMPDIRTETPEEVENTPQGREENYTPPANPIDRSNDVIDMDQDDEGVYIPRYPLANPDDEDH